MPVSQLMKSWKLSLQIYSRDKDLSLKIHYRKCRIWYDIIFLYFLLFLPFFNEIPDIYCILLFPAKRMYSGGILESACLSVCMNVFGGYTGISLSVCLSVCPCVHLCSKYYFLSKCLWGYQVTFSDSSSFTSCPILSVLPRRGLFRFLLNFKNHSSSN